MNHWIRFFCRVGIYWLWKISTYYYEQCDFNRAGHWIAEITLSIIFFLVAQRAWDALDRRLIWWREQGAEYHD